MIFASRHIQPQPPPTHRYAQCHQAPPSAAPDAVYQQSLTLPDPSQEQPARDHIACQPHQHCWPDTTQQGQLACRSPINVSPIAGQALLQNRSPHHAPASYRTAYAHGPEPNHQIKPNREAQQPMALNAAQYVHQCCQSDFSDFPNNRF